MWYLMIPSLCLLLIMRPSYLARTSPLQQNGWRARLVTRESVVPNTPRPSAACHIGDDLNKSHLFIFYRHLFLTSESLERTDTDTGSTKKPRQPLRHCVVEQNKPNKIDQMFHTMPSCLVHRFVIDRLVYFV